MTELGELDAHHEDFARRNTRIVAVSIEGRDDAAETLKQFPHLVVVADQERNLASAVDLIHHGAGPHGADAVFPTTILIDRQGVVRWLYRPETFLRRLSPEELLAEVDKHFSASDLSLQPAYPEDSMAGRIRLAIHRQRLKWLLPETDNCLWQCHGACCNGQTKKGGVDRAVCSPERRKGQPACPTC